jgi:transcriptional regulator with XRE-family HTH domain
LSQEINISELEAMLSAKRNKRSLRAIAEEIGDVSISTLSRVEQGNLPDLNTFMRLCRWLDVSPEHFNSQPTTGDGEQMSKSEIITAHLRADRTLAPETAEALATMIRLAYEAASRGDLERKL